MLSVFSPLFFGRRKTTWLNDTSFKSLTWTSQADFIWKPHSPTRVPATPKFLSRVWGRIITVTLLYYLPPEVNLKTTKTISCFYIVLLLQGFLQGTQSLTQYRVCFSPSPDHIRNMHNTALPIQVSNRAMSPGELQPLSAPRYRSHQFITVDFRLCLFSQYCYLIIRSFYFWKYSHAAGRSPLSYA